MGALGKWFVERPNKLEETRVGLVSVGPVDRSHYVSDIMRLSCAALFIHRYSLDAEGFPDLSQAHLCEEGQRQYDLVRRLWRAWPHRRCLDEG